MNITALAISSRELDIARFGAARVVSENVNCAGGSLLAAENFASGHWMPGQGVSRPDAIAGELIHMGATVDSARDELANVTVAGGGGLVNGRLLDYDKSLAGLRTAIDGGQLDTVRSKYQAVIGARRAVTELWAPGRHMLDFDAVDNRASAAAMLADLQHFESEANAEGHWFTSGGRSVAADLGVPEYAPGTDLRRYLAAAAEGAPQSEGVINLSGRVGDDRTGAAIADILNGRLDEGIGSAAALKDTAAVV
jgi:hypothetical protein